MRFSLVVFAACLSLIAALAAARAEVAIGFANPLSGPYAATGGRNLLAVMAAVSDLNAEGGVLGEPVRLVMVDDRCGVEDAVKAAEKLVRAGVVMVVGHMCSHSSLMAAAIYDLADVVMITPWSTHPRVTEEGRPNVFRLIGRDDRQGVATAELITDRWPRQRVAIVHDGSTYGQTLAIETRRALERRGHAPTLVDRYEPGRPAYPDLVDRLRDAQVQLLYIAGYGPDAGRIVAGARAVGLDLQVIGGDGLGMDEFWNTAGPAGSEAIFSTFARPHAASAAASVRRATSLRRFERGGLGAYAAVEVWRGAVSRAGTFKSAAVTAMLHRGRFETILGAVTFDAKGDLEGAAWAWRVWRGGRPEPLN